MRVIAPSANIINHTPDLEKLIEFAGRLCYKSEDKITENSHLGFIQRLKDSKHESVLEHGSISVRFVCDRGVSHELVRHRIASFSQESTRYCNYTKGKFGGEISVIDPRGAFNWDDSDTNFRTWEAACRDAEAAYIDLLNHGASPQEARSILPNSLKTELVVTANPREWLHIFRLRTAKEAHPQMREIMVPLQERFHKKFPSIFGEVL